MARLKELVAFADDLLEVERFDDYCPNGLQVEGRGEVETLVTGVTASRALLEAAREAGADAVLVHHGWFWRGEDPRITGMKYRRLRLLVEAGISLIAYHLPLDAHPLYGNNACLGERLGLSVEGQFGRHGAMSIGLHGSLEAPMDPADFARRMEQAMGRAPLHVAGGPAAVRTVAWCTGAAQGYIDEAADLGVDAFVTGEASEQTVHVARERGLHFFAAGHHATERYGVQALGEHLARSFGLRHRFIDVDNPV